MRGKYDVNDQEYVGKLFSNMTIVEQAMVVSNPFDVLWKQVWGDDKSPDYPVSKEKFEKLNRLDIMVKYISAYTEPEWGFPKGKRVRGETDLDCGIREFTEETNIPRDSYVVMKNIILEETFMGLNNIRYRHLYFLAVLKNPELINLNQKFTTMQRREISAISWKSFDECEGLVRPHHLERRTMLSQLRNIVESFETF
jgi:8-oxo-dGTP pyrophosphatase MutT (NUDIX family)